MQPIYLDNAASTRVADEVIALMTEVMRTAWGNPSAAHPQGAAARAQIEAARARMLSALGDKAGIGNIIWTSGCTEADALAVFGAARVREGSIVITAVEHPAISQAVHELEGNRKVVTIPVGRDGIVDPDAAAEASEGAALVAIVMVQNEIGIVQPVAHIAAAVRKRAPNAHIHVDAAQAFGKIPVDVTALDVDSIAIAGHKLHAPKGTGCLWLRNGVTLKPLWVGGGQQRGMRGGTQDAPGIAGLGLAAVLADAALAKARTRWLEFASFVTAKLDASGLAYRQLVPDHRRAPHILALGFKGVPATAMRTVLSSRGVYVSTGSACKTGEDKPSAVLQAIGLPDDTGMCRLSFGLDTTAEDVERAISTIVEVAAMLVKQ